jgi:hypothetical protein
VLGRRSLTSFSAVVLAALGLAVAAEPGAAADTRDAAAPSRRIPPDPPALSERMQWVFDFRWDRGEVFLLEVHKLDQGEPQPTPRVMGRFALELYEGRTLIERARFDFPMLGVPEPADAGWKGPARFSPRLKTRIGVVFPATTRGTRLELWDRAEDRRWPVPWPPHEGSYGPRGDGTSPADGGTD